MEVTGEGGHGEGSRILWGLLYGARNGRSRVLKLYGVWFMGLVGFGMGGGAQL